MLEDRWGSWLDASRSGFSDRSAICLDVVRYSVIVNEHQDRHFIIYLFIYLFRGGCFPNFQINIIMPSQ